MSLSRQDRPRRSRGSEPTLPRALQEGVFATDVGDEVVVYDLKQHRGHCLNQAAAVVWRKLDGQTSMEELVAHMRVELDGTGDEDMVWLALKELDHAQLLEGQLTLPVSRDLSRRSMLRRLAVAAALLPAITTMTAPPAHAQVSVQTCSQPDTCVTFSCPGGCQCQMTTEGTTVCVEPTCVIACTTSADCPPGTVCIASDCCESATYCMPIAPVGTTCDARPSSGAAYSPVPGSWRR